MNDWPFDDEFLRRLRKLRFVRAAAARRGWEEPGRGTRAGGYLEFRDHRPYSPGDDLRGVDWKVTARLGHPYVKTFRREEERAVALLVDASASMDRGTPNKFDFARRLAAAFSVLVLSGGSRLRLGFVEEGSCRWSRELRGAAAFAEALRVLAAGRVGVRCRLGEALAAGRAAFRDPATILVLSDLLERPDARREIGALKSAGCDPVLFQILGRDEIDPPFRGAVRLRDSEEGEDRVIVFDEEARIRYREGLEGFLESWEAFAMRHSLRYFFVPSDTGIVGFVLGTLRAKGVIR